MRTQDIKGQKYLHHLMCSTIYMTERNGKVIIYASPQPSLLHKSQIATIQITAHNSFHTKETPCNTRQVEFIHCALWYKVLYSTLYRAREVQLPLSHDCSLLFRSTCYTIQNIRFMSYMQHFFSFSCSDLFLLFPTCLFLFGVKEI